jgi:hypothetical protein
MTTITNPGGIPDWLTKGIDFRKQLVRRSFTLVYAGAMLLGICFLCLIVFPGPRTFLFVCLFPAFSSLVEWPFSRFAKPYEAKNADERQMYLRDRANSGAYRLMALATALSLMLAMLLGWKSWEINLTGQSFHIWHPQTGWDFLLIFSLYTSVVTVLPHMVLAWLEGDLLGESEEWTTPDPPRLQAGNSGKEK